MAAKLTLLIPQLLSLPQPLSSITDRDWPTLPALSRLLSRAAYTTGTESGDAVLFQQFGLVTETGQDLPHGAIRHAALTGERDQRWYLCIDPIHAQVDRSAVVPIAHRELELSQDECRQFLHSLNEHFRDEGWQIQVVTPHDWILCSDKHKAINTISLSQAMYHNMDDHLPRGADASYWHGIMNEVQMLLHGHPLNQARAAQGRLSLNSVWLWGSGVLPEFTARHWQRVFADDLLSKGLAVITNVEIESPQRFWSVLEQVGDGELLLVLNEAQAAQDVMGWFAALERLEQEWFELLLTALTRQRIEKLNILSGDERQFEIDARALRHWWRRTKKLQHWLKHDKD